VGCAFRAVQSQFEGAHAAPNVRIFGRSLAAEYYLTLNAPGDALEAGTFGSLNTAARERRPGRPNN